MDNNKLTAEVQELIEQESTDYANIQRGDIDKLQGLREVLPWDDSKEDYSAGATVWAVKWAESERLKNEAFELLNPIIEWGQMQSGLKWGSRITTVVLDRAKKYDWLCQVISQCRDALKRSYDVVEWPADGTTRQDEAIKACDELLALDNL